MTATAEGLPELLKRPLHYFSAGDLGTNPTSIGVEAHDYLAVGA
jgi:hypothetical protein